MDSLDCNSKFESQILTLKEAIKSAELKVKNLNSDIKLAPARSRMKSAMIVEPDELKDQLKIDRTKLKSLVEASKSKLPQLKANDASFERIRKRAREELLANDDEDQGQRLLEDMRSNSIKAKKKQTVYTSGGS